MVPGRCDILYDLILALALLLEDHTRIRRCAVDDPTAGLILSPWRGSIVPVDLARVSLGLDLVIA